MKVKKVSWKSPTAAREFCASLRESGFAVITDHPITSELMNGTYAEWAKYFASEEKFADVFDPAKQAGYFPFRSENAKDSPVKDLKEFYHYYPWHHLPSACQTHTPVLYRDLCMMGTRLLQWLQLATPAEVVAKFSMPLDEMVSDSPETLLRTLHYPPIVGDIEPNAIRAAAHEDINLITLLVAGTAPGLQVKDTDGRWWDVPCDPGSIVINSGDMLREVSGGYFPSTTHQVVNPQGEEARKPRFSIPLFTHPRPDVRLSERYTAREYLLQRLREIGLK